MAAPDYCGKTGKVRYTQGAAERASTGLKRSGGGSSHPYRCPHCHDWHTTSIRLTNDAMNRANDQRRKSVRRKKP